MTNSPGTARDDILRAALALDEDDREQVALTLLESLDHGLAMFATQEWQDELAGMPVGVAGDDLACEPARDLYDGAALDVIAGTPMDIHLTSLPARVRVSDPPVAGLCADGTVVYLRMVLLMPSGDAVQFDRVAGVQSIAQTGTARRWSEGTIAGRPAAFLDTVIDRIGQSGVFVRDDSIEGMTQLLGSASTLPELVELAEALYG